MKKLEKMGRAFALETLLRDYTSHSDIVFFLKDLNRWVDDDNIELRANCFRGLLEITIDGKHHHFTICGFEEFLDEFGFDETALTFGTEELWATALEYFGIVAE